MLVKSRFAGLFAFILFFLINVAVEWGYRFSNLLRPKLTSIRSDSASLAECAINLLLSDIRGEASASAAPYYGKAELSINKSTERK